MEPNFQTSFIPKRPMIEERVAAPRSVGLLTVAAIIIFLAAVIASAGLYFYKGVTNKNISQMENTLNLAKSRFEPSKIVQLEQLDRRLSASKEILARHVAISPIFKVLEETTMKTIQYTSFSYQWNSSNRIDVNMDGVAVGYRSIALQSDIFSENEFLIDPVFSNLSLDNSGNVQFNLKFTVDPNLANYKTMLQINTEEAASATYEPAAQDETIDLPDMPN